VLPPTISTIDYHTAGEPFRIVAEPPVPLAGAGVAERRARAIDDPRVQELRAVLCSEPRGHADMYGGFVVPADDDGADLGVVFWHKDGFSTACGHGTIALATWAVDSGRVAAPARGSVDVVVDVPSGRVTASVHRVEGRVEAVDFVNVPSSVVARDVPVSTGRADVAVTVAYGGAIYATVPTADVGLAVVPDHLGDLVALGREIKRALDDSDHAVHPTDPRQNGIYGIIWFDEPDDADGTSDRASVYQRNVTVFADGQVDRSPCGSGTCARLAVLVDDGRLPVGGTLRHESIVGTTFTATVLGLVTVDGRPAVVPRVTGAAYRTGEHVFRIDPHDPLVPGFVLR
jgi:proline racemase